MIRSFKALAAALTAIAASLPDLVSAVHDLPTGASLDEQLHQRVAQLELEMERRHAEAEGLLLKAKGKLDAARAAEERQRRLAESADRFEEGEESDIDNLIEAYASAGVPLGNGEAVEGVPPMQSNVGRRTESKRNAHRVKFGG